MDTELLLVLGLLWFMSRNKSANTDAAKRHAAAPARVVPGAAARPPVAVVKK